VTRRNRRSKSGPLRAAVPLGACLLTECGCAAGSATIDIRNNTGGSPSEAIVIQFVSIGATETA